MTEEEKRLRALAEILEGDADWRAAVCELAFLLPIAWADLSGPAVLAVRDVAARFVGRLVASGGAELTNDNIDEMVLALTFAAVELSVGFPMSDTVQ